MQELSNDELLNYLEKCLNDASEARRYAKHQLDYLRANFPNEVHGIMALAMIYSVMLKEFKEEVGED